MAVPKPTSGLEIALVAVGGVFALFVVLPLVPLLLDFLLGAFRGIFDVIVPGGRSPAADAASGWNTTAE